MKNIKTLMVSSILILGLFLAGCTEQQSDEQQQTDVDTNVEEGTLTLKITDKPGDLEIIHANVTISMVQVHKSNQTDVEDNEEAGEIENVDEYDDGFVAFIAEEDVPYYAEVLEDISFEGNATEDLDEPYNWTWKFGDGDISYERNASHNYTSAGGYEVNLTVTNNSGNGVKDWYLTTATIGDVDEGYSSEAGWYTIVEESNEFDLIALQDVTEVLGEETLTIGQYTQIRLTVEQATITIINETDEPEFYDMMIPSGTVKLIKPFWIYEDETTELTLDFNVNESVHQTGNNKFIMKPTIKVIEG